MAKKPRLRVIPLGGLDEIGKNMTVLEYGDDMVLVDAGIMFPDLELPGVDLVLPDYTYVLKREDKLRGIVITHGHEDHTGALPYLLRDLEVTVPVYGSKLTLGLIGAKLEEFKLGKQKLREVDPGKQITLGAFRFDFLYVNHSIPDCLALIIRTPVGTIVHTGDFKFDQTPVDGRVTDYAALTQAGEDGVLLMLSDSTGAEHPGYTPPEAEVGETLKRVIADAPGRVIVASFASHIHRVQEVCDAAVADRRKIAVTGRSMLNSTKIARELGYLHVSDEDFIDAYNAGGVPPGDIVVLSTGSQGEPLSALARMANGDHKTVQIQPGDTVVISASPVPGNEKAVSRVINRLFKAGADVVHRGVAKVHVSGHASSEELKLMLRMVKPRYFMPVHGETRHLYTHAAIAETVGMVQKNIFVMENGDCLELDERGARLKEPVESGVVYVDGLSVGDVGDVVLRHRQQLSSEGVATVVAAIDSHTGKLVGDVELVVLGLPLGEETADVLEGGKARVRSVLERTGREGVTDYAVVQKDVHDALSRYIWERLRWRPMIVPIVMEV